MTSITRHFDTITTSKKKSGRRGFLRKTATAAAILPFSAGFGSFAIASGGKTSRVAEVVRPDLITGDNPAASAYDVSPELLDVLAGEAVMAVTGLSTPTEAWQSLVRPEDTVGIKVNCLAGKGLSTHPALAQAVARGVLSAGVPPERVIIWDRSSRELGRAGYTLSSSKGQVRCYGSDSLPQPYQTTPTISRSVGSCFATLAARHCTALINIPILKDHDLSGVSLGMKNFYGAIHNPHKLHDNNCDPFIADLSWHPLIREKLRLVLVDGLIGQYHGGPALKRRWVFPFSGILAGTDPVAVDRIGSMIISEQREKQGLKPLKKEGREPRYIHSAAALGLGQDQPDAIDWLRV